MFDGIDAADDGLVGDQEFKNIVGAPSDVGVDEHEMGCGLDVHGLGDQVVAGAGYETVVAAKVYGGIDTQVFAHEHGLEKGLGVGDVHAAVVAGG